MSVDFFDCKVCGESVCECGDFVGCDCGNKWCSDECAEEDGFKKESCKLGYDVDDNECEKGCYSCDNQIENSCKYCREDDFEDDVLLEYVLDKHLNMSRQELIDNYKECKGGQI
jgi:hypothetical protein